MVTASAGSSHKRICPRSFRGIRRPHGDLTGQDVKTCNIIVLVRNIARLRAMYEYVEQERMCFWNLSESQRLSAGSDCFTGQGNS
jgi:hypothetical protein